LEITAPWADGIHCKLRLRTGCIFPDDGGGTLATILQVAGPRRVCFCSQAQITSFKQPKDHGVTKARSLAEDILPPAEVTQAALNGDLVLFVGAGASMLLGLPSWIGLAARALEDLRRSGHLNYSEVEQLRTLDPKKQLSIAKLIATDTGHKLDFSSYLGSPSMESTIYDSLNSIGCSCVTTNYDELLAPQYVLAKDGSATAQPVRRVTRPDKFFAHLLNEPGTVIHLHGAISEPESMVVATKEYLSHYDHQNVQEFLGELFARKVVVFLGYGLEEAEILEHVLRRAGARNMQEQRRFALQGFFESQAPLYEKLHRYYEASFGVHLLGFLRDKEDYRRLEVIVKTWVSQIEVRRPPLTTDVQFMEEVLGNA